MVCVYVESIETDYYFSMNKDEINLDKKNIGSISKGHKYLL